MTQDRWTGSSTPYIDSGQGDAWGKEAAQQGRSGTQRILSANEEPAPRAIAEALHLKPGALVVARQRVILLDDQPIEVARSYWPAEVAAGTPLASTGKIRGGAVTLLATLGYEPGTVTEDILTRPPAKEEAEALQLTDNSEWVLVLTRTITTPDGRPYEVSVMVSPGRIGRVHYSMKVD
ncbi:UTRA domain-containing protein [Streptomyces sp. NBC_00264]|uniref:GntR family transcriptional regulator n=1 Tax=unclassified Streptomyces TaxID=2593676 RepID=UPI0022552A99|nr:MULTISPECIES: UTRA domain-containing protein [unclassified Streptomyces]MCX5158111.1 UTRA domain-containing protein [Streptomyces sp. NBC_00305]MCX5216634.1 UTRA domain-containing protein [Streptomyces sp. NBC_00264]